MTRADVASALDQLGFRTNTPIPDGRQGWISEVMVDALTNTLDKEELIVDAVVGRQPFRGLFLGPISLPGSKWANWYLICVTPKRSIIVEEIPNILGTD